MILALSLAVSLSSAADPSSLADPSLLLRQLRNQADKLDHLRIEATIQETTALGAGPPQPVTIWYAEGRVRADFAGAAPRALCSAGGQTRIRTPAGIIPLQGSLPLTEALAFLAADGPTRAAYVGEPTPEGARWTSAAPPPGLPRSLAVALGPDGAPRTLDVVGASGARSTLAVTAWDTKTAPTPGWMDCE